MEDEIGMDGADMAEPLPPALDDAPVDDAPEWESPVGEPVVGAAIDDEPPLGGGWDEAGDPPPPPQGAVDGGDAGDVMGAGQPGTAPQVDLGQDAGAPMPPVTGDTTTPPPGAPTGVQGEAPPVPTGAGGGGGVIGDGQPTAPTIDLGQGDEAPAPPVDGDTTTAPPGAPTGVQGEAPPVPTGAGGGGGGGLGDIIGTGQPVGGDGGGVTGTGTGTGEPTGNGPVDLGTPHGTGQTDNPPPGAPTGVQGAAPTPPTGATEGEPGDVIGSGQPGSTTAETAPASLTSTAASQLLSGLLPGMLPEDVEVAIAGAADDGTVDVKEVINLLHAHGLETTETPAATVAEATKAADKVQLVGTIDGNLVPLTIDHIDVEAGLIDCIDADGGVYTGRVEDIDRAWKASGAPLITAGAGLSAPVPPSGSPAPPPISADPAAALPEPPPLEGLPAAAVDDDGGVGLGTVLGAGAVAFVPVAIGGGLLARKLARRT